MAQRQSQCDMTPEDHVDPLKGRHASDDRKYAGVLFLGKTGPASPSSQRGTQLVSSGVPSALPRSVVRNQKGGEYDMLTKSQVVGKITELIGAVEAINFDQRKQATKAVKLRKCANDLKKLRDNVHGPGRPVDAGAALLVLYKTAELIYSCIAEEK